MADAGIRAPNLPLGINLSDFIGLETVGTTKSLKRFSRASVIGSLEAVANSFTVGGGVIFTTLSQASANLNYATNQMAWVIQDATPANNGVYQKTGASGSGSWARLGDLPYSFYRAVNEGAGTANAIKASNGYPMANEDALIVVNITDTNTASPVTLSLNGGAPLTIKTASGNDPAPGGLVADMVMAGYIDQGGTQFRLLSDQASAAIVPAAEAALAGAVAAKTDAQDAADAAIGATGIAQFATKAAAAATTIPASTKHLSLAGYTTPGVGPWHVAVRVATEPSHAGKLRSTDRFMPDGSTDATNGGWWELVDVDVTPLMFGAVGDGTTNDTGALQALFDYGASDVNLDGKTFKYTSLSIVNSCAIREGHLASSVASGTQISVDKSARVEFHNVELSGGGSRSTYTANHIIVEQTGDSNVSRAVGIAFYSCNIHGSGMYGVYTKWANDVRIVDTSIADCAYACAMMLSPARFRGRDSYFDMLNAVGASSQNAYGIALTHNNENFNLDPKAGLPTALNPFPIDCIVDGCTFVGPQIWEAMDIHGGYQISFNNNRIYAAKHAINFGNGSNAAAAYAGYQNMCCNNIIDVRGPDGATHGVTAGYGIVIQGGAASPTGYSSQIMVTGNVIRGYGDSTPSTLSVSIHANVYVDYVNISNNIIMYWTGYGIVFSLGAGRVVCSNNLFDRMRVSSPSPSSCIRCDGSFTGHMVAIGNILDKGSPSPYYGLGNSGYGSITYGSDFRSATVEYSDASGVGRKLTYEAV